MLSPADVSREPDFTIGSLRVSPSARQVIHGENLLTVEPRVMQVLVLLARRLNEVVTRDTLFAEVWGGVMVGDDSLNRAVAGVRKVVALDSERISLETIPRTGYRLIDASAESDDPATTGLSRRSAVGGAMAATVAIGLGGWWAWSRREQEFEAILDRGQSVLNYGDPSSNPIPLLTRAVDIRPNDARALGLLAYASTPKSNDPIGAGVSLPVAAKSASRALAIDPGEPNARLAQLFIRQAAIDLIESENSVSAIVERAPDNINALKYYWNLLQCVGRSREALALVERALKIDPVAATVHYPLAQLLWIDGRTPEADRVIEQAIKAWPNHRFVRFARFIILTFSGRARAALAMLDSRDTAPQSFSPDSIALWRTTLAAVDQPTPAAVASARRANLEAARSNLDLTNQAVMALTHFGEIDAAFELLDALFVVPSEGDGKPTTKPVPTSVAWRFAPWLFIPPTSALHADPRFDALCDTIGLSAYWAKRGVRPDYQLT